MSKRKPEKEFKGPGCQELFDTAKHIPFIGTCGDSMCGDCVNEKKIKVCPVCNRRSFSWKQPNNLATELLAEKEAEGSQEAKLDLGNGTYVPGEPIPVILDPKNRAFLAQIINQLNPTSFLTLSRTCKTLQDYCFNTKEIRVPYMLSEIRVMSDRGRLLVAICDEQPVADSEHLGFETVDYTGYRYGFLTSAIGRMKLQKYPFVFTLDSLTIEDGALDAAFFAHLRSFLGEFPIQAVDQVRQVHWYHADWTTTVQFLRDFGTKKMSIDVWDYDEEQFFEDLDDDVIGQFFQNLEYFECSSNIPDRLILIASVPSMKIFDSSISKATFIALIKKFADLTCNISWKLGCQDFSLRKALKSFTLLPFDFEGALPNDYPIIFVKDGNRETCWLLRKDGKVMRCYNDYCIKFSMCRPLDYPRCVNRDTH